MSLRGLSSSCHIEMPETAAVKALFLSMENLECHQTREHGNLHSRSDPRHSAVRLTCKKFDNIIITKYLIGCVRLLHSEARCRNPDVDLKEEHSQIVKAVLRGKTSL